MQITFKNAGQGDSIIIEWVRKGEPRLGIIDCNLFQKTNPVVQHLQKVGCRKIDFIILSHPHHDHFSGMLELLEFCEQQKIPILTFAHSCATHPRYLNYANTDSNKQDLLQKIFLKAKALYESKQIRFSYSISQNTSIPLNENFILETLSPSNFEVEKFIQDIDFYEKIDFSKCGKAANYLSTVLKITNQKEFVLLAADAEKETFKRLEERHSDEFPDLLYLGQIPHHGSKTNHYPSFWSKIKRTSNCIAAVSTGGQYNHPHPEVIADFASWDYTIYSTNQAQTLAKPIQMRTSTTLDMVSELIEDIYKNGDLTFNLNA